jgi:hypothetical protein
LAALCSTRGTGFASQLSHLDPSDLKTLVQFHLLGDPSIHPVETPSHSLYRSPLYQRTLSSGGSRPDRAISVENGPRAGGTSHGRWVPW